MIRFTVLAVACSWVMAVAMLEAGCERPDESPTPEGPVKVVSTTRPAGVLIVSSDGVIRTLTKLEMVRIPGGKVEMPAVDKAGNLLPNAKSRLVDIKPFWIGKTEVTWDYFDVYSYHFDLTDKQKGELVEREKDLPVHARSWPSHKPYSNPDEGWGHEGYAVLHIHTHGANLFCRWLSEKTGRKYRLPTEAEWEYACRAGKHEEPFRDLEELRRMAWFADNSADLETGDLQAHPVGTKKPNAWGLCDMLGNAAEWVVGIDGQLVVKGGSFKDKASNVHSRARVPYDPAWQERDPQTPKHIFWLSDGHHVGFRVVMEDD